MKESVNIHPRAPDSSKSHHPGLVMVDPRASRFWQTATRVGLIDAAKLETCWQAVPPEKRTIDAIDRRLARQAVNSGLLTLWQAQQILAGRQSGLRIDRYVLLDQIGHGGMGRVYLARDTRLGRHVALKVLSRERMSNTRALARFRREAKVGAQLQHENLIRIYDEGEIAGMPYLVMEYITGQTVGQMIADQGRLEPALAAELGRQVSQGLDHLHQKGLLHRDVNPTNIMVDHGGTAKLTDLGLAIDLGDLDDVVTRDGATVGTFDYISPEQARNPRQIDTRSDIYSLGCTLYHMLSGRVPFPAPSLPEKLFAHQSKDPEPLVGQVAGIPEGLDAVVRTMMNKRPEDRYARPSLVERALGQYARATKPRFDEPSTPPQRRASSSSVAADQSSERGGSDPDLAIVPSPAGRAPDPNASSDPFEFVKLDLGPEPPLSESRGSAVRSRSQDRRLSRESLWLWVAASVLVVVIVLLLLLASQGGGAPDHHGKNDAGTDKSHSKQASPNATAKESASHGIVVEYADGPPVVAQSLQDAVNRAAGKAAAVVISPGAPLKLSSERPLKITGGRVVLRAEHGTRPIIDITLANTVGALQVEPGSSLQIEDVSFRVERQTNVTAQLPTLLHAPGELILDRCALIVKGSDHRIRAIAAQGRRLTLSGCWIEGFDVPVSIDCFPGTEHRIEQCMIVHAPAPANDGVATIGWPVLATLRQSTKNDKPCRLVIEACTLVGAGLIRIEGSAPKLAFVVEVHNTVASGVALVMWSAPSFPEGLQWKGRGNLYGLTGVQWVVSPPESKAPLNNAPTDLAAWNHGAVTESGSHARAVRFVVEPPGAGHKPSDYRLLDLAAPGLGADPQKVAAWPAGS